MAKAANTAKANENVSNVINGVIMKYENNNKQYQ